MKKVTRSKEDIEYMIVSFLFKLAMLGILAWIVVSYVDIIADNSMPNPSHFDWNFFKVMFKLFK